jgi:hypothetical protein
MLHAVFQMCAVSSPWLLQFPRRWALMARVLQLAQSFEATALNEL